MEQVITGPQIPWSYQHRPFTIVGSPHWRNYTVRCSVRLSGRGSAGILARIGAIGWHFRQKNGVRFMVGAQGAWSLVAYDETGKGKHVVLRKLILAHGRVPPLLQGWHRLALRCSDNKITVRFDSKVLRQVIVRGVKHSSLHGMAGLATGWNHAWFKDFSVEPLQHSALTH